MNVHLYVMTHTDIHILGSVRISWDLYLALSGLNNLIFFFFFHNTVLLETGAGPGSAFPHQIFSTDLVISWLQNDLLHL